MSIFVEMMAAAFKNDKLQTQHIMATKAHHSGDGIAGDACHFSFKVCLLGDSGVGKSELLKTAGKARHTCTQQAKLNAGCKSCQFQESVTMLVVACRHLIWSSQ